MAVLKHFMWAAPEFEPLNVALSKLALERDLLESAIPRVMITERTKPRLTRVLPRANWMDETGEIVQPAIPAFLGSLETGDRRANRLDLANWIVSRDNPLTARVVLDMYGAKPGEGSFASNCLLARRLAERGVRFIQLYHRNWDHHSGVKANVAIKAQETDQATAALIRDLKQRGMLDDTLVVWGGEFGRTPMSQGGDGRDHHIKGFSFLIAGGGVKGGISYGSTDDFGYAAQENPVAVPDFHATMLHLLGVDHKRLTVKFQGLDARLTGIAGEVVKDILA